MSEQRKTENAALFEKDTDLQKAAQNAKENGTKAAPPINRGGGLYKRVNISVKTANILVVALLSLLVVVTIFLVSHNGFTVQFDTDGGTSTETQRALHSETLSKPEDPYKEGYRFVGWYKNREHTEKWDFKNDTVSGSMTLYAGYEKNTK